METVNEFGLTAKEILAQVEELMECYVYVDELEKLCNHPELREDRSYTLYTGITEDEDENFMQLWYEDIRIPQQWAQDSGELTGIFRVEIPKEKMVVDFGKLYREGRLTSPIEDPRLVVSNYNCVFMGNGYPVSQVEVWEGGEIQE